MLETVFSEDFRGEQFPQFLQFLLEQFMYLETLFSYTPLSACNHVVIDETGQHSVCNLAPTS